MLNSINLRLKQRGIGLLELMLSLAIISILLVMATRYYKAARQAQQVNDAISLVQAIAGATANWVIGEDGYSSLQSIDTLVNQGYLPTGSQRDPWQGKTEVIGAGNTVKVTLGDVPYAACLSLQKKIQNEISAFGSCPNKGSSGDVDLTL